MTDRLFWPCWLVATALTGIVAGAMLGHVLILGRFLDWMLAGGRPGLLAETYPVFRALWGRTGLAVFYALAGLQVLAVLAFGVVAAVARRHRVVAVLATMVGIAWAVLHYASGFAAVETVVLQQAAVASRASHGQFLAWNLPVHTFHAGSLTVALIVLLSVPLLELRRR